MRARNRHTAQVSLFPFLSVLICAMGVLGFMAISFLLVSQAQVPEMNRQAVEFQWVGAPNYVKPVYIRCRKDHLVYYDIFRDADLRVSMQSVLADLQSNREGELTKYLKRLLQMNREIKLSYGTIEYYPLLLIYNDGVLTSEIVIKLVETQFPDLNVGLEPMLPHWDPPYQSES